MCLLVSPGHIQTTWAAHEPSQQPQEGVSSDHWTHRTRSVVEIYFIVRWQYLNFHHVTTGYGCAAGVRTSFVCVLRTAIDEQNGATVQFDSASNAARLRSQAPLPSIVEPEDSVLMMTSSASVPILCCPVTVETILDENEVDARNELNEVFIMAPNNRSSMPIAQILSFCSADLDETAWSLPFDTKRKFCWQLMITFDLVSDLQFNVHTIFRYIKKYTYLLCFAHLLYYLLMLASTGHCTPNWSFHTKLVISRRFE